MRSLAGTIALSVVACATTPAVQEPTPTPTRLIDEGGPGDPRALGVVAIVGALHQTCFRRADGAVYCAGSNHEGTIFEGITGADRPQRSDRFAVDDAALHLGSSHACALGRAGEVRCWGSRLMGQCGDGCTLDSSGRRVCDGEIVEGEPGIAVVSGLEGVEHLVGTLDTTCAVGRDGEVWCWGWNVDSAIGVAELELATRPVRLDVPPLSDLQAGEAHYCGVARADRTVWCWGHHRIADPPDRLEHDLRVPTALRSTVPEGGRLDVTRLGACVLGPDHDARCWGDLELDEGGPVLSVEDGRLTDVQDIAAGNEHTCVLSPEGTVLCMAREAALLGTNAPADDHDGWRVVPLPFRSDAVRLYAFRFAMCVLSRGGEVACWGEDPASFGVPVDDEVDALSAPVLVELPR